MKNNFDGIMPALLTPFTKGGERVDYDSACALAERLVQQGVQGIFVCGTTGEGMLMTLEERKKLLDVVVVAVGKKINVVAHTGCLDTQSTINLTLHAAAMGAAAAGIITPGFYGYDDDSLAAHYKAVAKAVKGFPILLYDLPSCARNALSTKFVLDLARDVKNIVGIKVSKQDIVSFSALAMDMPKDFALINGADEYTYQAYLSGATGTVSSTANVLPELFLGIRAHVAKGELKKAWAMQRSLSAACGLFQYGKMVAYYKEGLRLRGFDAGYVRPPQRELTKDERKAFAKALEKAKLI